MNRFSDGTVLESARGLGRGAAGGKGAKAGASAAPGGALTPAATAGRLAKFSDAAGGLTDSGVTENAGGDLGVGAAPAPSVRLNVFSPPGKIPFAFTQDAPESAFPTRALFSTASGPIGHSTRRRSTTGRAPF